MTKGWADYAKKSDLKDWLTSDEVLKLIKAQGYQTKADVQKLIEEATKNQLTADDVKKIFETMIASDETMGKLQAEMQKIIQQALVDGKYVTEQQMKDFVEGKGYIPVPISCRRLRSTRSLPLSPIPYLRRRLRSPMPSRRSSATTSLRTWLST